MINAHANAPHPAAPVAARAGDAQHPSDAEAALIARVARGDEAAFAELYRRAFPAVIGFAARLVGSPERAEEVAQDTMLTVWRTAPRFDRATTGLRWILVQAYAKAEEARLAAETPHEPLSVTIAADDPAERAAAVEAVREAVARLPQPERRAVEMVYLEGHTIAEVAAYEGRSRAILKARLSQGRRRLNRSLAATR